MYIDIVSQLILECSLMVKQTAVNRCNVGSNPITPATYYYIIIRIPHSLN